MKTVIEEKNSHEFESLVIQLFENHYKFYEKIGAEIIKSASGHTNQVSTDYQGRVLYELLQNAFDRAKDKVLVKVIDNKLYVANDGKKFTYNVDHDYNTGGEEGKKNKRSDFQSLCSISTSNKTAKESIGNKGVGFKSVYSLGRYADIHTKGAIDSNSLKEEGYLSFRLFDIFDNVDNIPQEFDANVKKHLEKTVNYVQREFPNRGVPGYYFPLKLDIDSDAIFRQFDEEIVTVIEVPFDSKEEVEGLINKIEEIHFEFVSLKYSNKFEIMFEANGLSFTKKSFSKDNTLFYANLNKDKIEPLAKKAGIEIEDFNVAIKFKNTPDGLFYNYLPTAKESPFKYVDFHADFHTTVDRKSINFDGDKIGAYNRALLRACVELYYSVLRTYSTKLDEVNLNVENINVSKYDFNQFSWNYCLVVDDSQCYYNLVRTILRINEWDYKTASNLFSLLALKYFEKLRSEEEHQSFFENICGFIKAFTVDYQKQYKRSEMFTEALFTEIKNLNVRVIPNINLADNEKVIYRKTENKGIEIPQIIPVKFTDFKITDETIIKILDISDYTEFNEILKHFKQCSFLGEVSEERITEHEQKKILRSCYELSQNRRESNNYLTSHRYSKAFYKRYRDDYSTLNQVNFNVSTLFLKLENGKFKPAQLCVKSELDLEYLDFTNSTDLDNWLRFLGVSVGTKFRFVDSEIYNKLKDGLDNPPLLLIGKDNVDRITRALIENINVVSSRNVLTHPALINDNNYSFLKNIRYDIVDKLEFDNLLVKKYNKFPTEYLNILKEELAKNLSKSKNYIIQFYQNIFEAYAEKNTYLIIENDNLKWVKDTDFFVLSNKFDFELCVKKFFTEKILVYYLHNSDIFKDKKITPDKGVISYSQKTNYIELKEILSDKILYILIKLSQSSDSKVNYLSENTSLISLQNKFENMKIYKCANLEQDLLYGDLGSDMSPKAYAYEGDSLYFLDISTISQKAQGLSEFLFNNISIKDQIELTVFHKDLDILKKETDEVEFDLINRRWIPDYQERFIEFQEKVLHKFNLALNGNEQWYKYNKNYQNDFLINLDKIGRLHELKNYIIECKKEYVGYFDMFQLEIDFSHINQDIVKIKSYCEKDEVEDHLRKRLETIIKKGEQKVLGIESEIARLKLEQPQVFEIDSKYDVELKSLNDELLNKQNIEEIYKTVKQGVLKEIDYDTLNTTNQGVQILNDSYKKIIYQRGLDIDIRNKQLEITGASGEEQVLTYLIHSFLELSTEEQLKGIEVIKEELQKQTGNNSFDKYAEECKCVIDHKEKLMKALIPLFYVTKKYKYARFDLITYKNGKPTLIEVKTTNNIKSNRFFLSVSEIEAARTTSNYEIVRVTPQSIIFFGNPIKDIAESIFVVKTDGFYLKPRNYELIIK